MKRILILLSILFIFCISLSASDFGRDLLDGLPGSSYLLKTGGTVTGDTEFTLNLYLGEYLFHYGDPNTYARFRIDNIQLVAGGLFVLNGSEGTVDTIYIGDGDWDYLIIGDTTTVKTSTFNYTSGDVGFPANVYINKSDKAVATSSLTWVRGDTLVYDGANWVIQSSKSFICVDISTNDTTATSSGVWTVIEGTYTKNSGNGFRIDNAVAGSTITYIGTETHNFSVTVALSASSSGANEVIHWRIAKNGTMLERSESHMSIPIANVIHTVPLAYVVNLATDDEISLFIQTNTGDTITHEHLVIVIQQID